MNSIYRTLIHHKVLNYYNDENIIHIRSNCFSLKSIDALRLLESESIGSIEEIDLCVREFKFLVDNGVTITVGSRELSYCSTSEVDPCDGVIIGFSFIGNLLLIGNCRLTPSNSVLSCLYKKIINY